MNNNKKPSESDLEEGDEERLTVAYTESVRSDDDSSSVEFTPPSSSSESSETQDSGASLLAELDRVKEREKNFGYIPTRRTMSLNDGPKLLALEYFWANSVFKLFSFLISHLLAHTPDEPIPFLKSLLERCIEYRKEGQNPPLLFEERHIDSVYTALDPMDDGTITYSQYLVGMETLGVTDFDIFPEELTDSKRHVPKYVFLREAKHALLTQLETLLGMDQSRPKTGDHVEQPSTSGYSKSSEGGFLEEIHDEVKAATSYSKSSGREVVANVDDDVETSSGTDENNEKSLHLQNN